MRSNSIIFKSAIKAGTVRTIYQVPFLLMVGIESIHQSHALRSSHFLKVTDLFLVIINQHTGIGLYRIIF
ncbi:hypothetical protein D3C72_2241650 [compost metagenome]